MALKNNIFAVQRKPMQRSDPRATERKMIEKGWLPPIPGDPFFDMKPKEPEPLPGTTEASEETIDQSSLKIEI